MVVYRFFKVRGGRRGRLRPALGLGFLIPPPPQNCLHEWAIDLAQRTPDEKRSIKGKIATRAHKQTKDYMRPFFRLCRRKVSACLPLPCAHRLTAAHCARPCPPTCWSGPPRWSSTAWSGSM